MIQHTMNLETKLETEEDRSSRSNLVQKFVDGARNYAIDTSAKIVCFAPLMGSMEAYNGMDSEQILKSRAVSALIDGGVARVYTKTADYLSKKFDVDMKKGGFKGWLIDTVAMVGVYTPAYAGVLAVAGADAKQIGSALLMGAGIATVASRPFRKYALMPWRKVCGYKK